MALTKNEIKKLQSLGDSKFRRKEGIFVVEGTKSVNELLKNKQFEIESLYHLPEWENQHKIDCAQVVSTADLKKISFLTNPQLVLAVVKIPVDSTNYNFTKNLILVLDGVRDPGNLGTILRISDWFGINQILLSKECADIYSPKVVQASTGSLFRSNCNVFEMSEILDHLTRSGFEICATDMNGESVLNHQFSSKTALILGNEGSGLSYLSSENATKKLSISRYGARPDGQGHAESLNVGVACGIFCQLYRAQFPINA